MRGKLDKSHTIPILLSTVPNIVNRKPFLISETKIVDRHTNRQTNIINIINKLNQLNYTVLVTMLCVAATLKTIKKEGL